MNGLSGSISTLEGTVNNNTASINNISTDVNAMKTGKQDKLVAGNGITIGSDGKTISSNSKEWKVSTKSITDLFSFNSTTKTITYSHCKILFLSSTLTQKVLVEIPHLKINYTFYSVMSSRRAF